MQLKVRIGDVIRYSSGITALMRLTSIAENGYMHGRHCMGGSHSTWRAYAVNDPDDIAIFNERAHWRHEAVWPDHFPRIRKVDGKWVAERMHRLDRYVEPLKSIANELYDKACAHADKLNKASK